MTMTHVVDVLFRLYQKSEGFEILYHGVARGVAVHSRILARKLVHVTGVVHYAHDFQIVAQSHFKVVGIVGGGYLDRTRSERLIDVFVRYDGYLPVRKRKGEHFADVSGVSLVLGVHCDRHIAEQRFGTRRRNDYPLSAVCRGITYVPEVPLFRFVLHFRVGYRGLAVRAKVYYARSVV